MKIVKILPTELASPFNAGDDALTVRQFVDSKNVVVDMADIGTFGVIVITQGDTIEMVKFDDITQNDDGSAEISVATSGRDIDPTSPYAGYAEGQDFSTGATVKFSNDPLTMSRFANLDETSLFTVVPSAQADPVSANDLTRKSYVDALLAGTLTTIDVIVPAKAGATIAAGNLVYFDTTSDRWELTDADTSTTVLGVLLGIAQGAGTDGNPISGGVLLQGVDTHQSGMTEGNVMYASNTIGGISSTEGTTPTSVGIARNATELYFIPNFNVQLTKNQKDALNAARHAPTSANPVVTTDDVECIVHVYNANATWTKPAAGLKYIEVEVQAAGAGSGTSTSSVTAKSGGGASGSYAKKTIAASLLAATEAVVVGVGGLAGDNSGGAGSNGQTGGTSSFGAFISALGGLGSLFASAGTTAGGLGQAATGGDINIPGQPGEDAFYDSDVGGKPGRGGDSILGKSAPSSFGNDVAGKVGYGYGAGATGSSGGGSVRLGAAGKDGIVIVREFYA